MQLRNLLMPLVDDIVVVAGATGRVGGETLREILRAGARAAVISRSAAAARGAIARYGGPEQARAIALEADLRNADEANAAISTIATQYGRIDAVICLAGGGSRFVSIVESGIADLRASVENNLVLAYNLMLPALRSMLRQPQRDGTRSRGRLVAVSAGSSVDPQPDYGVMGAGKAGVNTLMRAIAREHKADGIVANAVVLGGVATDAARGYLNEADFAAAATPVEVAKILAFHAADDSSGVNGELIHLNAREVD